jgi:DNA-binding NtrC family response regulator
METMQERGRPLAFGDGGASSELAKIDLDPKVRGSIEVLVIDDEHSLRESCASLLRSEGFTVTTCGRGDDALRLVATRRFDVLLLDLYMSHPRGLDIMKAAIEAHPDTLVIVMTGNPSVESSVTALRAGAWDYLPKPFSATHFQILLGRAAHAVTVAREGRRTAAALLEPAPSFSFSAHIPVYGRSKALSDVVELANKVAQTDASVFITGESGTGKEVIAQYIHLHSRRKGRELVSLNCAAIPEALLESEMFGHVEGAFTGAVRDKEGLLEVANGGTLFLDELTEMPLPTQAKLLRVLQDGAVRRVGSTKTDAVVDVRFIAATNRDPSEALSEGSLRRDLHYRLRVVPIHIPPLRERPEDIPILAEQFLKELWLRHREKGAEPPVLSDKAIETLLRAPWPGNVRELRNVIEHLVVLVPPGTEVGPQDITFMDHGARTHQAGPTFGADFFGLDYHKARDRVLSSFEIEYLSRAIQAAGGNISDAARLAGVDRTTLYRLMEKHGMGRDALVDSAQDQTAN